MQIEKISETEADVVIPITEQFRKERVTLDIINKEIDKITERIITFRADIQTLTLSVDKLKAEKDALVLRKQALRAAGLKTNAEVEEAQKVVAVPKVVDEVVEPVI